MDPPPASLTEAPRELRLLDLRPGLFPVIIAGRVLHAERRTVKRSSDGTELDTLVGWITDGSATVRFTWWEPPAEAVDRGDGLRAGPIGIREYRGRIEISFGRRTRVEPLSELELPRERLDTYPRRTVASLRPGEDEVRIDVEVAELRSRTLTIRGVERQLRFGRLRDESGALPFVAWVDPGLADGARLRLAGVSVRSYRGELELVLDERSRSEPLSEGVPAAGPGRPSRAEARVRRDPPPPPSHDDPEPAAGAEWVSIVRRIANGSPDGYADRDRIERAGRHLPLPPTGLDALLAELVRRGRLAEPLAGLYRPGDRRTGD